MKKIMLTAAFFLISMLLVSRAYAEEAKPAGTSLDDIKNMLGLSIYLQGGYNYNFADPDSQENRLRIFDHKANSFTLDLAQIVFNKDAAVGGVGYRLKLSAGETAKFIHATGLGINPGENPDDSTPFDLTEAYIDYIASLGNGLKFRFGKFVTMHGAEVIEAKDDMNYSRSLLFDFAIPFTHTGLMVGYPFSDKFGVNFYVVNGWDNFTKDTGSSKTLGLSISYTPAEQFSFVENLMNGREVIASGGDVRTVRFLSDTVITVKPVKNLAFVINGDYGTQSGAAADGGDAKWYGVAGYVKYDFSDLFSSTIRAEYFDDKDGFRTGTAQKAKEVTLTPEFRVAKNLIVRPEYRHDWSDKNVFDSHSNIADKKSQDTIALGVMYTW